MRARSYWTIFCAACWPAAGIGAFDPTDVVQIQANANLYYDSNLFRLPPDINFGVDPARRSDTARILGVGLKVNKLLSRQRLIADLNLNDTRYDKNSNLDFFGGDGRVAWLWQIGNLWSGEAGYRQRRFLGGFEDQFLRIQDLVDSRTYTLSGGYEFHPRWRISAELADEEATHSAVSRRSLDFDGKTSGLSLTYHTPAANSIGVQAQRTERRYPERITTSFDHSETRLNAIAKWRLSGAITLDGQIGYSQIRHDVQSDQNFAGLTWRAGAAWDLTGKFRVNLAGSRKLSLYETTLANYVVIDGLRVSPTYAISEKVALQAELSRENREYRPGIPQRKDKIRLTRIGLTYSPVRNLDVSLSYETGDRNSNVLIGNIPINDYEYQSWFGTVRARF